VVGGKILICWRLPGAVPDTIETKQAEFRAQPKITVGRLSNRLISPLVNPSRIFHEVRAYWLTSFHGSSAKTQEEQASIMQGQQHVSRDFSSPAHGL
jgi:hypothetical protein